MELFIEQILSITGISAAIGTLFSSLINYIFYKKQQNRTTNIELVQKRLSFYSTLIDSLESFWMFVTTTKDWYAEKKKDKNAIDSSALSKLLIELDKSYYHLENILQDKTYLISHTEWSDWFVIKHLYISIKIRNDYSSRFLEELDKVCSEFVKLLENEQADIIKTYNEIIGKSGKYLQIDEKKRDDRISKRIQEMEKSKKK